MPGLEETRALIQQKYPKAKVEITHLDVADESSVAAFFALAVEKFGRVDFLANVAGYGHPAQLVTTITEEQYERSYRVNLRGVRFSLPI